MSTRSVTVIWDSYDYICLGLWPSFHCHIFTVLHFSKEKHTFSHITNFCYWHLLLLGRSAAEERTRSGWLWSRSQAPGDRGSAAEHWDISRAASRYFRMLCAPVPQTDRMYHVQHWLYFIFKKSLALWFFILILVVQVTCIFGIEGAGRRWEERL